MSAAFDEAELLDRVDHDMAFLDETVQMLAGDGRALMTEVREAAEAGDAAALGRAAHALKGMISNFCAPDAQACALEVEWFGKAGDAPGAAGAVCELEERLEALVAQLQQFIKTRS